MQRKNPDASKDTYLQTPSCKLAVIVAGVVELFLMIITTSIQMSFYGKCKAEVADAGHGKYSTDDVQGNCAFNLPKEKKLVRL